MARGTELATTRRRWRIGSHRWKGRVVRQCFDAEAASIEASLWDTPFPGMSGPDAALCMDVETQESWRPNRSRIIALYESPRKAGRAKATVKTVAVPVDMNVRATAEFGEAWKSVGSTVDDADKDKYWWQARSRADAIDQKTLLAITLETAYPAAAFDMNDIVQLHRHVNSEPVEALMAISPRQLLFQEARSVHSFNPAELVYFDLDFILDPDGWTAEVEFELHVEEPREDENVDPAGELTSEKSTKLYRGAKRVNGEIVVKKLTRYEEGDLTSLVGGGLIEW